MVAEGETGLCRVLCFSPRHDLTLSGMAVADIERVVDVWVEETIALGGLPDIASVQIFENRGEMMGASNPHPHGQIWATRHLPNELEKETHRQGEYLVRHGRPLLIDYLERELKLGERIVFANEDFCVLAPFWAIWPFETMILPRRRIGGFDELKAGEKISLAAALSELTKRYDRLFDTPFPYSMGFHQKPTDGARACRMADACPFLPAAPALGDGQEVHGRLRDAGLSPARPYPRGGGRAAAAGGGISPSLSRSEKAEMVLAHILRSRPRPLLAFVLHVPDVMPVRVSTASGCSRSCRSRLPREEGRAESAATRRRHWKLGIVVIKQRSTKRPGVDGEYRAPVQLTQLPRLTD